MYLTNFWNRAIQTIQLNKILKFSEELLSHGSLLRSCYAVTQVFLFVFKLWWVYQDVWVVASLMQALWFEVSFMSAALTMQELRYFLKFLFGVRHLFRSLTINIRGNSLIKFTFLKGLISNVFWDVNIGPLRHHFKEPSDSNNLLPSIPCSFIFLITDSNYWNISASSIAHIS